MLNMKFRTTLLLVIVLLASVGLTLAQNPDPTGTGNEAAVDLEKGIPPIPVITGGIALNSKIGRAHV